MNAKLACRVMTLFVIALASSLAVGCGTKTATAGQPAAPSGPKRFYEAQAVTVKKVADSARPNVAALVKAYNSRNFGSPGWRRVSLELVTDGEVTRNFEVVNLWQSEGELVNTLFLLQEPRGLSGTNYLLTEDEKISDSLDMKVHLFLPSGQRQVLEIEPSNFNEGLLGSDFTYSDMRMRLPVSGYRYRLVGEAVLRNEAVWVIEAEPSNPLTKQTSSWSNARFYLARDFQFMLGADYYAVGENDKTAPRLSKSMRVDNFEQKAGVWTATRMTSYRSANHFSVLTLRDAHFKVAGMEPRLFSTEWLPILADKIRQGWSPSDMEASRD